MSTVIASWNWRIKIPIDLPIRAYELGRLRIQLWNDRLITSYIVGEAMINIYDWLILAYHRQRPVFPFKEVKMVSIHITGILCLYILLY